MNHRCKIWNGQQTNGIENGHKTMAKYPRFDGEYNTRQDRLPRSKEDLPNGYESNAYKVRALRNVIANALKACYAFYCIMKCFRKRASQHSLSVNQQRQIEDTNFSCGVLVTPPSPRGR
jgi:hypothetical protein